jgi:general secretion pathway protein A
MYNEFYGFSEKPFEVVPNSKFIYLTPHDQNLLDSLISGIKDREEFISITGAAGTGKTALLYHFLNTLKNKVKGVLILRPIHNFRKLLKDILWELDLSPTHEGKIDPYHQLINYLEQVRDRGEQLVIIIDEAQSLSREVMEELQVFIDRVPKIIQIIFVGQSVFEDKLNSSGLRSLKQRIKIRLQMKPLSEEESSDYIDHRLRLVGRSIFELFTPRAISLVYDYTQGIPLVINILCDNALRVGYELTQKRIDVDIIQKVIEELEGPGSPKRSLPSIKQTKAQRPSAPHSKVSIKIVSFAMLALVCLGGVLLLIRGGFQKGSTQWGELKTFKSHSVDTQNPKSKSIPPESLKLPPLPSPSHVDKRKEKQFIEMVTVKAGQTISSLSQEYYRMTHTTLLDIILDFNPEITNVHLILINQEIKIPKITEELFIIQSSEGTCKIHVGTFSNPDISKLYRNERFLMGKEIEVLPRKVSAQETWYRVVVGKFDNREEALKAIHLLREKGLLPFFRKSPR